MFKREFSSYNALFDAIYLANTREAKQRIRVPLSAIVDYKGFRGLVLAVPPIQPEKGLAFGFDQEFQFKIADFTLKYELSLVGQVLNLEESYTKQKVYNPSKIDERTLSNSSQVA